ncbi:MAG TPA: hemolysin family protein [Microthrixaceae bacterium]|nr:hemolysin family protein [Microthrixaceae bacterium]
MSIAALLVLANAFFVAVEFALVAVDRTEVELAAASGDRRAALIASSLSRLNFHLSGAQLGITATSLALGFVAEPAIAQLLEEPLGELLGDAGMRGLSLVISLGIATVVQMVIGELIPKAIAVGRPLGTARTLAPLTRGYVVVMAPVIRLFVGAANRAVRRFGIEPAEELSSVRSRAELVRLVRSSAEEGTLEPDEVDLLTRVFRFGEKTAADVLTPRTDVVALASSADGGELTARSVETGYSRFPVYDVDLDDIVGVVHVKSLFGVEPSARSSVGVTALMAEPFVVPEAMPIDELLDEMRGNHQYLAVVLDEYGGTAGIATSEDLVEEIVGEIDDEHDPYGTARRTTVRGTGTVISGGLHADEVREVCGFEMPDGEYETLAGFVLDRLGRIPDIGDEVVHDGWHLVVGVKRRHRIVSLIVTPPPPVTGDPGEAGR